MQEWYRFFRSISFNLSNRPVIWCDNQQTVSIVTKAQDKLASKLKHVDIHQLWLRQEVNAGHIDVKWLPTAEMPADGLTKILPRQKHIEFVRQLGLVDIKDRLQYTYEDFYLNKKYVF